eukprot:361454-Chlamydomonas_euryale.AAC.1
MEAHGGCWVGDSPCAPERSAPERSLETSHPEIFSTSLLCPSQPRHLSDSLYPCQIPFRNNTNATAPSPLQALSS